MTPDEFSSYATKFVERGISIVPIAPNSKRPGRWSESEGWCGMGDWTRFSSRHPTELEIEHWSRWPDAGIGVILGQVSGIIALDRDYDVEGATDALDQLIPMSPVAKRGAKGWTKFYQFNGERSCGFNVKGHRVLDVLANGRQTVIPPTMHPSGVNYVWITYDTLDEITSNLDLPKLPDDFLEQVGKLLEPYQTEEDRKYQQKNIAPNTSADRINQDLTIEQQYFRSINSAALANLDLWVPKLIPNLKKSGNGYRTIATWRHVKNHNVGIHPNGIADFGNQGSGLTPIDLVRLAQVPQATVSNAVIALRELLGPQVMEDFSQMTVGGRPMDEAEAPPPPRIMPWHKPSLAPPPAVLLPPTTGETNARAVPDFVMNPPGMLGEIARWISATAPKEQPELSVAAAIALGATVMQRIYRSNNGNFTSLYVVMVAKSTEGKEHPQACVESALTDAGLTHLLVGSGYTASGAVFSALLRQPSHLAIIDEMGKLLKLSRAKGNSNGEAALDKLVEAFGKLDGVIRPPVYSTMTLSKAQADAVQPADRVIYNPAISLLGATTPGTFYGALTDDLVQDGFLGRLLVVESTQPRQMAKDVNPTPAPQRIIDWCQAVNAPAQRQGNLADQALAETRAVTVEMRLGSDTKDALREFEIELNALKDQLESDNLDVLLGRTREKAIRLAMIAAKAEDKDSLKIEASHIEWAIKYVRHYDLALIRSVKRNRIRNTVDGDHKRAVQYIRAAKTMVAEAKTEKLAAILQAGGMPHTILLRRMHMKSKDFDELMNTAVEAGLVTKALGANMGYAGVVYYATDE